MKTWIAASLVVLAIGPDVVHSVDAIPAHIAGRFRDPFGFERSASGQFFVFDRRSQIVWGVDPGGDSAWEIVHIGNEPGRILNPFAFAVAPDGSFHKIAIRAKREGLTVRCKTGYFAARPGKP